MGKSSKTEKRRNSLESNKSWGRGITIKNRFYSRNIWAVILLTLALILNIGCDKSYQGVKIYSNDGVNTRHVSEDGYNYGLRWQCVEFVKRYYYQHLNHKMPNSYGHAKDFFNKSLKDGEYNKARDLYQYINNGENVPSKDDLIIFDGTRGNPYGHVAIVGGTTPFGVIIYQQNTRKYVNIINIKKHNVLGWLRKSKD